MFLGEYSRQHKPIKETLNRPLTQVSKATRNRQNLAKGSNSHRASDAGQSGVKLKLMQASIPSLFLTPHRHPKNSFKRLANPSTALALYSPSTSLKRV